MAKVIKAVEVKASTKRAGKDKDGKGKGKDKPSTKRAGKDKVEEKASPWAGGGKPLADGTTVVAIPEDMGGKGGVAAKVRAALKGVEASSHMTDAGKCRMSVWDDAMTGVIRALAFHGFNRDHIRCILVTLCGANTPHEGTVNTQYGVGRAIKAGKPPAAGVHGGGNYCTIPGDILKKLKAACGVK